MAARAVSRLLATVNKYCRLVELMAGALTPRLRLMTPPFLQASGRSTACSAPTSRSCRASSRTRWVG